MDPFRTPPTYAQLSPPPKTTVSDLGASIVYSPPSKPTFHRRKIYSISHFSWKIGGCALRMRTPKHVERNQFSTFRSSPLWHLSDHKFRTHYHRVRLLKKRRYCSSTHFIFQRLTLCLLPLTKGDPNFKRFCNSAVRAVAVVVVDDAQFYDIQRYPVPVRLRKFLHIIWLPNYIFAEFLCYFL